jgi:hypothetical protein
LAQDGSSSVPASKKTQFLSYKHYLFSDVLEIFFHSENIIEALYRICRRNDVLLNVIGGGIGFIVIKTLFKVTSRTLR